MILAKLIWMLGAAIILVLGSLHLLFTFFTNKFYSKNENVITEMKASYPILTRETTMWKAWIGFNASHSVGAIFFGVMNIYTAYHFFPMVQHDPFFLTFNIITVGFYLWLAKKYWFRIPFSGILLTLICFLISFILTL